MLRHAPIKYCIAGIVFCNHAENALLYFRLNMIKIGIDLGGTKIEIVALDENNGELLRRRIATPQSDYRTTPKHHSSTHQNS